MCLRLLIHVLRDYICKVKNEHLDIYRPIFIIINRNIVVWDVYRIPVLLGLLLYVRWKTLILGRISLHIDTTNSRVSVFNIF